MPVEAYAVEYYCRGCGWTSPEYQEGDPAYCPGCGVEYEPSFVFGIETEGTEWEPPKRTRTWARCGAWCDDGSRCERRPGDHDRCAHHRVGDEL